MSDWTAKDGRSNSSDEFNRLVQEITLLIRESAYMLIIGHTEQVATLILAQLAHIHNFGPLDNSAFHIEKDSPNYFICKECKRKNTQHDMCIHSPAYINQKEKRAK